MECQNNITVAPRGDFTFPAITTTTRKETHWKEVVRKSTNSHKKIRSNAPILMKEPLSRHLEEMSFFKKAMFEELRNFGQRFR